MHVLCWTVRRTREAAIISGTFSATIRPIDMRARPGTPLLVVLALTLLPVVRAQPVGILALAGGTIYSSPSVAPILDGVVLIEGKRIVAVGPRSQVITPAQAHVIDCAGMFVVAGFQNSHIHFTPPGWTVEPTAPADRLSEQLAAMLTRWGFSTVVDTGSDPDSTGTLRRRIESGEVRGPRILTAGLPLYPPNGVPFYLQDIPADLLKRLPQPATPGEASAIVRDQTGNRDILKLFVGSWVTRERVLPMPPDIAIAAANEAHRAGKLVFAHPSNVAGLEVALKARVDVLAHALDNTGGLTNAHFRQMRRQEMAMIPTLKLFDGDSDVISEVRTYFKLGGQILFGTDVGYLSDLDPTREYELMRDVGLGWRDTLASLTTNPATRFGESRRRGQIAKGMDAEVVVLNADPAKDIRAFADVRYTIREGKIIFGN